MISIILFVCFICSLILFAIVMYNTEYEYEDEDEDEDEDEHIISKHTDHDKTRVIKENGKTKELYVTIDGEEYHFVFEENKE